MLAGLHDINIEQGSSWTLSLTWKDDAGIPINLSGYKARMKVRKSYAGPAVLELSSDDGDIVLGGALGTIVLSASSEKTGQIGIDVTSLILNSGKPCQKMVWDMELDLDGTVTRLLQGAAFMYPEATK